MLVRKGGKSRSDARDALLSWRDTFPVVETSPEVVLAAADLATDHQLGIWDAVILIGRVASGLSSAFVQRPSRGLHLGWSDGGQSILLLATARPAECSAGGGCRIARTLGSHGPPPSFVDESHGRPRSDVDLASFCQMPPSWDNGPKTRAIFGPQRSNAGMFVAPRLS